MEYMIYESSEIMFNEHTFASGLDPMRLFGLEISAACGGNDYLLESRSRGSQISIEVYGVS